MSPRAVVLSVFALVPMRPNASWSGGQWRAWPVLADSGTSWLQKLLKLIFIIVSIILRQCMSHYVCSAGWPGTIVDQADLELTEIFLPLLWCWELKTLYYLMCL